MDITQEIQRRRTFAIISHPDAGKTTLTEKLLLYGGAVQLAGSVTARKHQRATTSDWMELEKKRGISISSTVLQFDYDGYRINLLDTPGHKDFSEDTYRVLTAVDSVVMVIDAAKGIESQTRKLFEVCRQRGVPIFTFMNKCDRPMREPLALLDELERVLGIGAFPVNWPIGTGGSFQGVFDRRAHQFHLFQRTVGGQHRAPVSVGGVTDPEIRGRVDETTFAQVTEELEMLEHAGETFDDAAVLAGETTPVFFGSAVNNFGVQLLLDGFLEHSPPPRPRLIAGTPVEPGHPQFSGFIFKIQANMDPRHRDRIAFLRVCTGRFERDMTVLHTRTGRKVRLASSHKLFGNERETVDEAYPARRARRLRDRRHADPRPGAPVSRDSPVHARGVCIPAQSEHGEVQAVPAGVGSVAAGGRRAGARVEAGHDQGGAACGGGAAAVRGYAVPARERVRGCVAAGDRAVDRDAVVAAGAQGGRPRRAHAAHRRAARLRHGAEPGGLVRQRMVGRLLRADQSQGPPDGAAGREHGRLTRAVPRMGHRWHGWHRPNPYRDKGADLRRR
jgi:small GTP-binding protein